MTRRPEVLAVTRQELSTGCRNRADANVVGLAGLEQLNHSRPSREMDTPTVDYVIHALIDQPTALLTAWPIAPPHKLGVRRAPGVGVRL